MPKTQEMLPTVAGPTDRPRVIVFLAYPGMGLLDLTGPQTVFWSAAHFLKARGVPGYVRHTVSVDGGMVVTAEGVGLDTRPVRDVEDLEIDTVVVPGAYEMAVALADEPFVSWLRTTAQRVRRVASVCSGAFLLAKAGLLEGRRATTHWQSSHMLASGYPGVTVQADSIYVNDGPVWSSAGVSTGIDLCLAMVQDDCGHALAMQVARQLVLYVQRPGGQSQFSELLKTQVNDVGVFTELHRWIERHLGDDGLSVETLADQVHMSPRNFSRSYKEKTGQTPARALELFRLEAARRLLEQTRHSAAQIARKCGFGSEERMRVTFQRHLKVSPSDYRSHFSTAARKTS
jgi:transcriptional regulator GlxA family with amidase domain